MFKKAFTRKPSYIVKMEVTEDTIRKFILAVKETAGYNFTDYSQKSFRRRIEKILVDHNMPIGELIDKVKGDSVFLEQIVREITVNTTELFRDKNTWFDIRDFLQQHFSTNNSIKIWSAGCSNGLEMYSLVILLNEMGLLDKASICGSDLNSIMVEKASAGVYPFRHDNEFFDSYEAVMKQMSLAVNIEKYFVLDKKEYSITIKPEYKRTLKIKKHNLLSLSNPFGHNYDLILCRNVLIYFNHNLQDKLFHFFHRQITNNGALVLGVHEGMLGPVADKYFKQGQIYTKVW